MRRACSTNVNFILIWKLETFLSKPVWQMTGEEFIFLNRHALQGSETKPTQPAADKEKKYVYGIAA